MRGKPITHQLVNQWEAEAHYKKLARLIIEQQDYIAHHYYGKYINPNGVRRADRSYLARLVASQLSGKPIWTKPKPGVQGVQN
jgi:hypothetical protein